MEQPQEMDGNVTVHCMDCDSEDIVMYDAVCVWSDEKQEWVYEGGDSRMFQCSSCGMDNIDYNVKKVEVL